MNTTTHIKTVVVVVGVCVGIIIGEWSLSSSEIGLMMLTLGSLQFGVHFLFTMLHRARSGNETKVMTRALRSRHTTPLVTALFSIAIFIGILRFQLIKESDIFVCKVQCTFTATIVSSPQLKNEYQSFIVRPVHHGKALYDVSVRAPLYPRYEAGEVIDLSGYVREPHTQMQHEDKKSFDYGVYLETKHVGSEMHFPKITIVESSPRELPYKLMRLKEYFVSQVGAHVEEPEAALASGMLFGVSAMSDELLATFRTVGLSHIIVLSGFNIAILIASVLLILQFLPLVMRILLAGVFTLLFVVAVGAEASVVRATIMAFVSLAATLLGRNYVARQALIISLLLIVFYDPKLLLHSVSLHLSFLATAGIVYLNDGIKLIFRKIKYKALEELCVTSCSAYFATLPYVMYTFGTVSIYALLANCIVLPIVPVTMLISFFTVVSGAFFPLLASAIGLLDTVLLSIVIWVARLIESLPFSSLQVTLSFGGMCALYIFLIAMYQVIVHFKKNETHDRNEHGILTGIISY